MRKRSYVKIAWKQTIIIFQYPPPRLARTAFLKFRRQAPLYHLLTYTLVPPYLLTLYLLKGPETQHRPWPHPLQNRSKALDLQKLIFSLPGPLKINIYAPYTSKNRYVRSQDFSKSIFSLPGPLKSNIFIPRTSKSHDFGGFGEPAQGETSSKNRPK